MGYVLRLTIAVKESFVIPAYQDVFCMLKILFNAVMIAYLVGSSSWQRVE